MRHETTTGQRKDVELNRGLFLVHYTSAEDTTSPPVVRVFPGSGHERQIQIFTHPDSDPNTLWHPNTSLVVKATAPATLHVEVLPAHADGSRIAAVKIEQIQQGQALDILEPDIVDLTTVRILGHVAGIGDVMVAADQWIAGPSAPSRIEGIAIEWPQQPDLKLKYAVKSGGQSGKMIEAGEFAGTRGRALPITGLILELSGKSADVYQITADAIFLSSPNMRVSGKSVVLSGPTGREPLVGFRFRVAPLEEPSTAKLPPRPPRSEIPQKAAVQVDPKATSTGRVKVFRSRTNQP